MFGNGDHMTTNIIIYVGYSVLSLNSVLCVGDVVFWVAFVGADLT